MRNLAKWLERIEHEASGDDMVRLIITERTLGPNGEREDISTEAIDVPSMARARSNWCKSDSNGQYRNPALAAQIVRVEPDEKDLAVHE